MRPADRRHRVAGAGVSAWRWASTASGNDCSDTSPGERTHASRLWRSSRSRRAHARLALGRWESAYTRRWWSRGRARLGGGEISASARWCMAAAFSGALARHTGRRALAKSPARSSRSPLERARRLLEPAGGARSSAQMLLRRQIIGAPARRRCSALGGLQSPLRKASHNLLHERPPRTRADRRRSLSDGFK